MTPTFEQVRARLERVGQGHVLHHYASLDSEQKMALLRQVNELPIEQLPELITTYVKNKPALGLDLSSVQPARVYTLKGSVVGGGSPAAAWDRAKYRAIGEDLLRKGKVAAFTVAGGQGTRLGFDGPKGMYLASAVRRRPLFACLAEWILASQQRWGKEIPWYIMTSPLNHEATVAFFREHGFFGLKTGSVVFFPQGVMPSLEMHTGRILMEAPGVVATNPDGHGGSLRALWHSGAIADMAERGIEHISYVQIDNPLARVIDPVFIGLHAAAPDSSGEMSSKMVQKTTPGEKVGVFARVGGTTQVLEYSDLPSELAEARDDGQPGSPLKFNAGSIAIHMISVAFVSRLNASGAFGLPYHRAEKKVPCIDIETGKPIEPTALNAVKLETFVFDALPLCKGSIVMETDRVEEFAPIKNADGADSPASCRELQTLRAARWLERVGVQVPFDAGGKPECVLEISPLTAMDPEDLRSVELPKAIAPRAELAL